MFAFVFRRMMDFDQILPIAVAMAEAGHSIRIGVMGNDLKIENDPRFKLFPVRPRIWKLRQPFAKFKCWMFLRDARCLVMDWARLGQNLTELLTDLARKKRIPSIALPHGVDCIENINYYHGLKKNTFCHFDQIVTPNKIRWQILLDAGVPQENLRVMGAPRFTKSWMDKLCSVYPSKEFSGDTRLKVLFFEQIIPEKNDAIISTMEKIASLDYINLVIQQRPIAKEKQNDFSPNVIGKVDTNHASPLCKWADVIIGMSSTIMIEALVREKHLIWTRYLAPDDLFFSSLGGAWIVNDDNELVAIINKLHKNRGEKPVDRSNFCNKILWAKSEEAEYMESYCQFLVNASVKENTA